jgi:hypothetical protein
MEVDVLKRVFAAIVREHTLAVEQLERRTADLADARKKIAAQETEIMRLRRELLAAYDQEAMRDAFDSDDGLLAILEPEEAQPAAGSNTKRQDDPA